MCGAVAAAPGAAVLALDEEETLGAAAADDGDDVCGDCDVDASDADDWYAPDGESEEGGDAPVGMRSIRRRYPSEVTAQCCSRG